MRPSAFRNGFFPWQALRILRFALVERLWITEGMSSSTDLEQIESRIVELVKDFVTPHADDAVASSCKDVADAVARQAVTSSEGSRPLPWCTTTSLMTPICAAAGRPRIGHWLPARTAMR